MKILHIITSLNIGGAEKLLVESVPLYGKKGIEADVLVLNDNSSIFRELLGKKSNGKIRGLTKASVYNPLLIFKIIPFLRKYDIAHTHLFPTLYWVVLAKWLSFSKTKIIYTEHSTNNRRRKSKIFQFADRIIYKGVAKIVTIAEEVDENIKSHLGFKSHYFQLIHNGVDISSFSNAKSMKKDVFFSKVDFILIQVSNFRVPKDQQTLIKSLKNLPKNIKLLLVGDGPLRKDNEILVKSLALDERVLFLGIRTDIPALLQMTDVAVLSSHYEGLSLASIEGMVANPFIASDVPGLREIVGGYGLLFEKGNAEELANHILRLYNDKLFYNKIAKQCFERAKEFDIHKMVDNYIDVYKKLLNNG